MVSGAFSIQQRHRRYRADRFRAEEGDVDFQEAEHWPRPLGYGFIEPHEGRATSTHASLLFPPIIEKRLVRNGWMTGKTWLAGHNSQRLRSGAAVKGRRRRRAQRACP